MSNTDLLSERPDLSAHLSEPITPESPPSTTTTPRISACSSPCGAPTSVTTSPVQCLVGWAGIHPEVPKREAILTGSMSRRRQALNIPTLQRHLSFKRAPDSFTLPLEQSDSFDCVTPLEQVIHTPLEPPSLRPRRPAEMFNRTPTADVRLRLFIDSSPQFPETPSPFEVEELDLLAHALDRKLTLSPAPTTFPRRAVNQTRRLSLKQSPVARRLDLVRRAPLGSPFTADSPGEQCTKDFFLLNHSPNVVY